MYLRFFAASFATKLEYRASYVSTLLVELTTIGSTIILWSALYKSQGMIGTYSLAEAVFYYLFVLLVSFFTEVWLSDRLGNEIREGRLSLYLMKPINIVWVKFSEALASKIYYLLIALPVYVSILLLIESSFHLFSRLSQFGSSSIGFALVFAICAFVMHFFMDMMIAWLGFWLDEIWSLVHLKTIAFAILGGMSFPLDVTHGLLRTVVDILPFKYFYFIPTSYLLGKRGIEHIGWDFAGIVFWTAFFIAAGTWLWHKGLKKYAAYGH